MSGRREGNSWKLSHQGRVWALAGILILAGIVLFLFEVASAGVSRFGWGMMSTGGWGVGWFAVAAAFMMVGGFLFVVLLFLLFWRAVSHLSPLHGFAPGPEDPLTVLKRRYAKGEISKEQFDQITRDLASVP